MKTTNIIDSNALGHAFHRATKLTVGDFETQAIYGMLRGVQGIARMDTDATNIMLWDGRADFRFALNAAYKSTRELKEQTDPAEAQTKGAYRKQVPYIKKMFSLLGVRQMTCANLEADDLAGYFAPRLSRSGKVRLITGDSDWLQLVNENTEWIDIRGDGKKITHADFFEMTGYMNPRAYIQGKALIGDTTDDIPPAGGIGEKGAAELLAIFGSIEEFWRRCDAGEFVPKSKAHLRLWKGMCDLDKDEWAQGYTPLDGMTEKEAAKALKKHNDAWPGQARRNWLHNMQMMDLTQGPAPAPDPKLTTIDAGAYNEDAFRQLCERLAFRSILRDFDTFVSPFRRSWASRQLPVAA